MVFGWFILINLLFLKNILLALLFLTKIILGLTFLWYLTSLTFNNSIQILCYFKGFFSLQQIFCSRLIVRWYFETSRLFLFNSILTKIVQIDFVCLFQSIFCRYKGQVTKILVQTFFRIADGIYPSCFNFSRIVLF